jgi:hypothetical protein
MHLHKPRAARLSRNDVSQIQIRIPALGNASAIGAFVENGRRIQFPAMHFIVRRSFKETSGVSLAALLQLRSLFS